MLRELRTDELALVAGGHDPDPNPDSWGRWMDDNIFGGEDGDHDGIPDHSDSMNGGDDTGFHLHGGDGTTIGQNPDGTFTLYDQNGNPSLQLWTMTGVDVDTGGSAGVEASRDGAGIDYSTDGNTYHFAPAG